MGFASEGGIANDTSSFAAGPGQSTNDETFCSGLDNAVSVEGKLPSKGGIGDGRDANMCVCIAWDNGSELTPP